MKKPILFLIFNRPDKTQVVFNEIKKYQPEKIFIAADGPRQNNPKEAALCLETRDIVKQINWKCEIKTLFREKNLGCKIAVSEAIGWFFENIEEGIILEDDCVPEPSFFTFCEILLEKYRHTKKVMIISGNNLYEKTDEKYPYDYYFSKFSYIWGWATWKRVWSEYDVKMKDYPKIKNENFFDSFFYNKKALKKLLSFFDEVFSGKNDTWDAQLMFLGLKNNYLSVIPSKNLIKNIGFDSSGTHTKKPHKFGSLKTHNINTDNIKHPPRIEINEILEKKEEEIKNTNLIKKIYFLLKGIYRNYF